MCDVDGCGPRPGLPPLTVDPARRRSFLKGLASLPLATVLAIPDLSRAAAGTLERVAIEVDGASVSAALALPDAEHAPAIILIHEWWGLNDQIKSVAAEFAKMGYIALAVDLYAGEVATTGEGARALMGKVDPDVARQTLVGWNRWLRAHLRSSGKIGTVGWCFGGGWSLQASLAAPVDATVVYYGNVAVDAERLKALRGPVLGHFATRDDWIDQEMVSGFAEQMKKADKADSFTVYWYEADHAFANPSSARYDAEDAALSWQRTGEFFKQHLG
jgi:carboxymethylenebutenolidase